MMRRVGIVGQGFVGTAVREFLRRNFDVYTFDLRHGPVLYHGSEEVHPNDATEPMRWIVENVDGPIFLCLPSPMGRDGQCDTSIVTGVVAELDAAAASLGRSAILVLKSTVPPGTTAKLNESCRTVRVCFNPEFLREASHLEDFKNQDRIVLGGPASALGAAAELFARAFPGVPQVLTTSTVAETVKYVTNAFLAVKVSFANEVKGICDRLNIDYSEVIAAAALDRRLGASHWAVPGPDGKPGFGGSCFPKDLNAFIALAQRLGALHHTMLGAWTTNLAVRPERDWEQLHGRAVNYK